MGPRKVRLRIWAVTAAAAILLAAGCVLPDEGGFPAGLSIERVSVSASGTEGNGVCGGPSISADGRYVAFNSGADNLVPGDANGGMDVFVYDRQSGSIERVSVDSLGSEGDFASSSPSISADGRWVAFRSGATNLVAGDSNDYADIFVYDRQTDSVERVSVDGAGTQANGSSNYPTISADGRYVAFQSDATNLVADDTNAAADIFVYDLHADSIERVSVDDLGNEGNAGSYSLSLSADGQWVAFSSAASNLVSGDTNLAADIFVYDRQSDTIERVSVDGSGIQANGLSSKPSLSADGQWVAFYSAASNLVSGDTNLATDIFVYDRQSDTIERVSVDSLGNEGNGISAGPSLSADGRYVAFYSDASDLLPADTNSVWDILVYDRQGDSLARVSVDSTGTEANGLSSEPSLSADGRYVAFSSEASNLVAGDTNSATDVFAAPVP